MADFERDGEERRKRARGHPHREPWNNAPPWAWALRDMLARIDRKLEMLMPEIDDLNAAVADLQSEVATIGADMDAQVAALEAAHSSNDLAAVAAATANIRASVDALKAAAARDMPAASPPAPAPAPQP